jgi:predicted Zn-dependent protease
MDKPKPPPAKVPFANRPPLAPPASSTSASKARSAQAEVQTAPAIAPGAKEAALDKLLKLATDEMTWAEAMGITQHEAFGIAQSAYRMFEFGQQERGRKAMHGLIAMNPQVGAFHALLGGMAGKMGDEATALKAYSKAIELEPNNLAARVNRAEMRLKQGMMAEALDDLIAATKIDPKAKSPLGKRAFSLARVTSQGLKELIAKAKKAPPKR